MFSIKTEVFGNIDRGQDPDSPLYGVEWVRIESKSLEDLASKVGEWIGANQIGAGNWGFPLVFRDGEPIGRMSYNGRLWADKEVV